MEFRVTYLTGTTPTNIVLHADYAGPKTAALALYDAGDGVWTAYTSRTIPVVGSYVAFKGDWRTAGGIYSYMFKSTFQSAAYTCKFSGTLPERPSTYASAYYAVFQDCTAVTSIEDNPMPKLVGGAGTYMYYLACAGMTGVTSPLPAGFMDTSGLTGPPQAYMFGRACDSMTGVTGPLPAGFMDTSGLTGSPAQRMFWSACYNMLAVNGPFPTGFLDTSGMTGSPAEGMFAFALYAVHYLSGPLPTGFMDTSGLTGATANYMFDNAMIGVWGATAIPPGFLDMSGMTGAPATEILKAACYNMWGVTNAYTFNISSNVSLTAANVGTSATDGPLASAWRGMTLWPGTVMWGTNVLFSAIAPSNKISSILGSTNVPGYAGFDANWK